MTFRIELLSYAVSKSTISITYSSPSAGKLVQFLVEDGGAINPSIPYAEIEVGLHTTILQYIFPPFPLS